MGKLNLDKSAGLKEQRNRTIKTIKQRKAFLTKEMKTETGEITKAKNNAQSALALKKIIKGNERTKKQKNDSSKITKHFENHFTDPETEELAKGSTSFFRLIIESEVREAVKKLSKTSHLDLAK